MGMHVGMLVGGGGGLGTERVEVGVVLCLKLCFMYVGITVFGSY